MRAVSAALLVLLLFSLGAPVVRSGDVRPNSRSGSSGWGAALLTEPRLSPTAIRVADKLLFAGGPTAGTPSSAADVLDVETGVLQTATLSAGREDPRVTVVGATALFAGGRDSTGYPSAVVDIHNTEADTWSTWTLSQPWVGKGAISVGDQVLFVGERVVDIYDSAADAWSAHDLVVARRASTVAVVGHIVLLAGGVSDTGPSEAVDVYDADSRRWSSASLAEARSAAAVAVVKARAILAGGDAGGRPSSVADIYDSITGRWTSVVLGDPHGVRDARDQAFRAVAIQDRAYFVGGATVNVYDAQSGTWSAIARSSGGSVVPLAVGSKIVFAGAPGHYVADTLDVYDTEVGTWSTTRFQGPPGSTHERIVGVTLTVGSRVLFAGGTIPLRANRVGTGAISIFDADTGTWSMTSLTLAGTAGALVVGNKALFSGARGVEVYDSGTDQWSSYPLSEPRSGGVVAVSGRFVLVAGGVVGTTAPDRQVSRTVDLLDLERGVQSVGSLDQARHQVAAASVGGKVIIAGGLDKAASYVTDTVDVYDYLSDRWSVTRLSRPGAYFRSAVVGGKAILFASGQAPFASVELYDSATDVITALSLSAARAEAGIGAVGPVAVVAGGYYSQTPREPSDLVDMYDLKTGESWVGRLSEPRSRSAVVTVGSKLLVAGGTAAGPGVGVNSLITSTAVDIYDAERREWTVTALSDQRGPILSWAAVGTKAIFAGGIQGGTTLDSVDIYDAATETWSVARLSSPRWRMDVAVVGSKAVFAGGISRYENARMVRSTAVDVYDVATGAWSRSTRPLARIESRLAVVGTQAIFTGEDDQVEIYDTQSDRWSVRRLPAGNLAPAVAVAGTTVLFAGGRVPVDGPDWMASDAVDLYDSVTGVWSAAKLARPRGNLGAGSIGTRAIFAGGGAGRMGSAFPSALVDVYDACEHPGLSIGNRGSVHRPAMGLATEMGWIGVP